jgi:hypothetical protein
MEDSSWRDQHKGPDLTETDQRYSVEEKDSIGRLEIQQ